MTSPEQQRSTEVKTGAIEKAAAERAAELARNKEQSGETYNESEAAHAIEKARIEAQHEAISGKEHSAGEHVTPTDRPPIVTASDRNKSYEQTMQNVRQEMSAPARTFSKIIHNPAVARVSDTIGGTVARPNAILSGSICAFVLVLAVYLLGRHIGFSLTGSETMICFALGWALGIAFDIVRSIFKR